MTRKKQRKHIRTSKKGKKYTAGKGDNSRMYTPSEISIGGNKPDFESRVLPTSEGYSNAFEKRSKMI